MASKQLALGGVLILAAAVCCLVAIHERDGRSPSALLGLGQKLYPYPYGYGYGYPYGYGGGYGYGYPYDPYGYGGYYDGYNGDDAGYADWANSVQQQQYADYVNQAQYQDYLQQQNYVNQVNAYNQYAAQAQGGKSEGGEKLKVAGGKGVNKLVYMGDFEMGGYRHDITGGNDGGYNAPYDLNGDGQYVDNWGKVATQWKHKKGAQTLKQVDSKGHKAAAKEAKGAKTKAAVASGKGKAAKLSDKQELQLEDRKLQVLAMRKWQAEEARAVQQRRVAMMARAPVMLAKAPPSDQVWQNGFGPTSGHPAYPKLPNEGAPMRPWYWKLGYDKTGGLSDDPTRREDSMLAAQLGGGCAEVGRWAAEGHSARHWRLAEPKRQRGGPVGSKPQEGVVCCVSGD
eukprot:CAMPEP_0174927996 /NCGR_PEP_ID=MMETSP1355-20121228/22682_1 /TAXON_ID=464990 /ORGANISM="Hemiselmis tepida, Strain CCMP443" /LENGTH=397 /DNA_ID=CAMNT_0016174137 /DNA_START=14 /DNA_END=1208 /DNA_ORIENTATION=-